MPIQLDITENAMFKFGEKRGEAKGEIKGQTKVLTRVLERRFGPLPESVRIRIAFADSEVIERWVNRLDSSTLLDAVFAG